MTALSNNFNYKLTDYFWLAASIAGLIIVSTIIGLNNTPGIWYEGLNKPPFNPPNWIFAPVWTVLYALIAFAGWRTFMRDKSGDEMKIWGAQMVLNWSWSFLFFSFQLIWPAFIVIVAVAALIAMFIFKSWSKDRAAALVMVPYLAWVSFATLLNLSIGILN